VPELRLPSTAGPAALALPVALLAGWAAASFALALRWFRWS
jgi:hypothetical protein